MQLTFLRSTLPCQKNSTRESYTIRIGRLMHDFKYERKRFVDSILCYSDESMCLALNVGHIFPIVSHIKLVLMSSLVH